MSDLPMLSYEQTRCLFPAYKRGDKAMLRRGDATDLVAIMTPKKDGSFFVHGHGFGTSCTEEELAPVANDTIDDSRPGIYRHSSGKLYMVIGGIQNVTTKTPNILYRPLYECPLGLFSRTPENFDGVEETGEKKFVKIANR